MIKKILNSGQNANNFLKLNRGETGCCGDTATDCRGTATYTQSNTTTLLNILEAGVATALPFVLAANATAATAKTTLLATLAAAGYEDDGDQTNPGVVVTDLGSTVQVVITGDISLVSITASGGAATFTNKCIRKSLCTYSSTGYAGGAASVAATDLKINGVTYNLGAITAGTTTAADVAIAINAAMVTAAVLGTAAVTTTGSGGSQTYNVTITGSEADNTYILAGVYLNRTACALSYV